MIQKRWTLPPASFRSRHFFHLVKRFVLASQQHLPFFFVLFPPSLPFLLHVRRRSKVVHFSLGVVDVQSTSEHRRQTERPEHGETEERDAETDKLHASFSPRRRHLLLKNNTASRPFLSKRSLVVKRRSTIDTQYTRSIHFECPMMVSSSSLCFFLVQKFMREKKGTKKFSRDKISLHNFSSLSQKAVSYTHLRAHET